MSNKNKYDIKYINKLLNQGYVYIVYAYRDIGAYQQGDIISKHESYEAAAIKANKSTWFGIQALIDAEQYALLKAC
jgi:hypothetical protein